MSKKKKQIPIDEETFLSRSKRVAQALKKVLEPTEEKTTLTPKSYAVQTPQNANLTGTFYGSAPNSYGGYGYYDDYDDYEDYGSFYEEFYGGGNSGLSGSNFRLYGDDFGGYEERLDFAKHKGEIDVKRADNSDTVTDMTYFKDKVWGKRDKPQMVEVNRIDDDTFYQGALKTIIVAGNGVFEYRPSMYGYTVEDVAEDYGGMALRYEKLKTDVVVNKNPYPRLPRKAIESVIEWYRRIEAKNGEEAQVVFYHNMQELTEITTPNGTSVKLADIPGVTIWEKNLFSYTPMQVNNRVHTKVRSVDPYYDYFNTAAEFGMYIETHSHNSMDAFMSGEDLANSANDGFQLVFGHLNTKNIKLYSWTTANRVLKEGLEEDALSEIMELHPDRTAVQKASGEACLLYPHDTLLFDENVFEAWDKQVYVAPKVTRKATTAAKAAAKVTTPTRTVTPTRPMTTGTNRYIQLTLKAEKELVVQAALSAITADAARDWYEMVNYLNPDEAFEMAIEFYRMGYMCKKKHNFVNLDKKEDLESAIYADIEDYFLDVTTPQPQQ